MLLCRDETDARTSEIASKHRAPGVVVSTSLQFSSSTQTTNNRGQCRKTVLNHTI